MLKGLFIGTEISLLTVGTVLGLTGLGAGAVLLRRRRRLGVSAVHTGVLRNPPLLARTPPKRRRSDSDLATERSRFRFPQWMSRRRLAQPSFRTVMRVPTLAPNDPVMGPK